MQPLGKALFPVMEIPFVLALCYPCFNFLCFMRFLHLGKALEIQGETVLPRAKLSPKDNNNLSVHMCACSVARSCPTLCTPMDCSLPGSPVYEIFPARILEWVVISFSRGSPQSREWTPVSGISCIGRRILYHCTTWEAPSTYLGGHFSSANQTIPSW